jgi:hypothetical protein
LLPLIAVDTARRAETIYLKNADGHIEIVAHLFRLAILPTAGVDNTLSTTKGGRQTLRDWMHRFNDQGPAGLVNIKPIGRRPRLSAEQQEALRQVVEAGPGPEKHGVVR